MLTADSKCHLLVFFIGAIYFMWMDVALWYHVKALRPSKVEANSGYNQTSEQPSIFHPMTIKLVMSDPVNQYIYTPICELFVQMTHYNDVLWFVSADVISVFRVLLAVPGARLLMSDSLSVRQAGLAVFVVSCWLDALDGVVHRLQTSSRSMHVDVGSLGYFMDGVCDAATSALLMLACLFYFRRHPPRNASRHYLPMVRSKNDGKTYDTGDKQRREFLLSTSGTTLPLSFCTSVCGTLVMYALQLALASAGWNHAIAKYQSLLENPNDTHTAEQLTVLKSAFSWLLMWMWRYANYHAMVDFLLIAVFIDKTWEYLREMRFIGLGAVMSLIAVTELHIYTIAMT